MKSPEQPGGVALGAAAADAWWSAQPRQLLGRVSLRSTRRCWEMTTFNRRFASVAAMRSPPKEGENDLEAALITTGSTLLQRFPCVVSSIL